MPGARDREAVAGADTDAGEVDGASLLGVRDVQRGLLSSLCEQSKVSKLSLRRVGWVHTNINHCPFLPLSKPERHAGKPKICIVLEVDIIRVSIVRKYLRPRRAPIRRKP